jgi:hypothetical protein
VGTGDVQAQSFHIPQATHRFDKMRGEMEPWLGRHVLPLLDASSHSNRCKLVRIMVEQSEGRPLIFILSLTLSVQMKYRTKGGMRKMMGTPA